MFESYSVWVSKVFIQCLPKTYSPVPYIYGISIRLYLSRLVLDEFPFTINRTLHWYSQSFCDSLCKQMVSCHWCQKSYREQYHLHVQFVKLQCSCPLSPAHKGIAFVLYLTFYSEVVSLSDSISILSIHF